MSGQVMYGLMRDFMIGLDCLGERSEYKGAYRLLLASVDCRLAVLSASMRVAAHT